MSKPLAALVAAICLGWTSGAAAHEIRTDKAPAGSPYAPYEFLVGDWGLTTKGSSEPIVTLRFKWGPNKSYLTYSAILLVKSVEQPHFEGMLVWNGVHKNLDMLLTIDMRRGLAQEQGTVSIGPDGVVVRDITAVYSAGAQQPGEPVVGPDGATQRYRQTFRKVDANHVETNALREGAHGWAATFPGSEALLMTRK